MIDKTTMARFGLDTVGDEDRRLAGTVVGAFSSFPARVS
jgi:hypothetical protein